MSSALLSFLIGFIHVTFTVVGAFYLLHKAGRRTLMIIGNLGMAIAVFCLGFSLLLNCDGIVSVVSVLVFIMFFALTSGPVNWVYLSEVL